MVISYDIVISKTASRNVAFKTARMSESVFDSQETVKIFFSALTITGKEKEQTFDRNLH